MLSGYKFRAYPTAAQAAALRVWIGHQRFIYNAKVREAQYWRAFGRSSLALTGLTPLPDQAYSQFVGPETQFLREVPAQVLRNGAYRFATGCSRMLKGLSSPPTIRKRHGRQSVLVTSELFHFEKRVHPSSGEVTHALHLGTKSRPLGRLHFKAHRAFELPKMLSVSVEPDGRWYVSFCNELAQLPDDCADHVRTEQELAYEFGLLPPAELAAVTVGIDRGVVLPVATSNGDAFVVDERCARRIAKNERAAKRHQRRMARQQLGSKNRAKTRQRLARCKGYAANVRRDFAHKASHALATSPAQVFVFEELKLKNMTAAPAPKQDAMGRYTANGAAAKAGLNRALLSSALGLVKQFTAYKAAQRNKLVLSVAPHHSSQECAECGHTAAQNRLEQANFRCVACGHAANADVNAARVIQRRGMAALLKGVPASKRKTARVRARKEQNVGPERPERGASPKPVENVSDVEDDQFALGAVFCEAGNRHLGASAPGGR